MSAVENLLVLYAGVVLLNTALAAALWWRNRTPLYRGLLALWAFTLLGLLTQALLTQNNLCIVLGFSFVYFINLILARLISTVVGFQIALRPSIAAMLIAYVSSTAAYFLGAHFTWVALPVALAVAGPIILCMRHLFARGFGGMTFSARALAVSSVCFALHNLDFAFLRHRPEMAALGFTLAILIVFALSIFAPAVALEVVTQERARISAEIELAHRIQMEILPKDPRLPGVEIACYMKPAEAVGGDYFDMYDFGTRSWILLGDVTGHGLSAGLVMLMAQSIISSLLHSRPDIQPHELYGLANQVLIKNLQRLHEDRAMTIVALCREDQVNRFKVCGSHDDIYIYRAAQKCVETVVVDHFPCGIGFLDDLPQPSVLETYFELRQGDILFVGTDGVTEAARGGDYARGQFEFARLAAVLSENAHEPIDTIKQKLISSLDLFTDKVYHDDVTFILARLNDSHHPVQSLPAT